MKKHFIEGDNLLEGKYLCAGIGIEQCLDGSWNCILMSAKNNKKSLSLLDKVVFTDAKSALEILLKLKRHYNFLCFSLSENKDILLLNLLHKKLKVKLEDFSYGFVFSFEIRKKPIRLLYYYKKNKELYYSENKLLISNGIRYIQDENIHHFMVFLDKHKELTEYNLNKLYKKFDKEKINNIIKDINLRKI